MSILSNCWRAVGRFDVAEAVDSAESEHSRRTALRAAEYLAKMDRIQAKHERVFAAVEPILQERRREDARRSRLWLVWWHTYDCPACKGEANKTGKCDNPACLYGRITPEPQFPPLGRCYWRIPKFENKRSY